MGGERGGFSCGFEGGGPTSVGEKACGQTCLWSPYVLLDYEFTENCGLSDFGDTVAHPFRKCSPGYCNPNGTELCSPCSSGATTPARMESHSRTQKQCRKVLDAWALGQGLPEVAVGCCGFHEQSSRVSGEASLKRVGEHSRIPKCNAFSGWMRWGQER